MGYSFSLKFDEILHIAGDRNQISRKKLSYLLTSLAPRA